MKKLAFCMALLLGIMISGCGLRTDGRLPRLDARLKANADSVLAELTAIDALELSRSDAAYRKLLITKAEDRLHRHHTTDSVILQAVAFYKTDLLSNRYAEALFYAGRVKSDMGDIPAALEFYQKALEEGDNDNLMMRSRIVSQMGELLVRQGFHENAATYLAEAVRLDSVTADTVSWIRNLAVLSDAILHQDSANSAIALIQRGLHLNSLMSPDSDSLKNASELNVMMAAALCRKQDYDAVIQLITPDCSIALYEYAAEACAHSGRTADAIAYASSLIGSNDEALQIAGYRVLLSDAVSPQLSADNLRKHLSAYLSLAEHGSHNGAVDTSIIQTSYYNYSTYVKRQEEAEFDSMILFCIVEGLLVAMLIAVLIILFIKRRERIKIQRLKDTIEKIRSLRSDAPPAEVENMPDDVDALRTRLLSELAEFDSADDSSVAAMMAGISSSEAYGKIREMVKKEKVITPSSKLWDELKKVVDDVSPEFHTHLAFLTKSALKEDYLHLALIIKCGFSPSDACILFGKSKSAITYWRKSLLFQMFNDTLDVKLLDGIIQRL